MAKYSHNRLYDLFIIIGLVLFAVAVTVTFRFHFLTTTLLFFGLPSLFLLWRKPSNLKKGLLAGFLLGFIYAFSFDYIAEFNRAWGWSTNTNLSFPVQFFGVVSLDILVWYFLWVLLTVLFYEYFVEYDFSKKISPNFSKALGIGLLAIIAVVGLSKFAPDLLKFQYAYFLLGIITLIPFGIIMLKRPSLFPKVLEILPFFIFLYFSFEIVALYTGLWSFPGQYIGIVTIFGLQFPFEELLFWILMSSAVTAAYHELVIDDGK